MSAELTPVWIDRRLQALESRPWRKVHLDFHNSHHVRSVGAGWDADGFVEQLRRGHVNSIVVFAKDMHGYFYYWSDFGPVHPALATDLLGEQVRACRDAGIKVYAYYCVTWDNHLAEHHPEWLVFKRDRTTYLPKFDQTPGWTALCLANHDFVDLVLAHSREVLSRYEVDGIWYDMPLPIDAECFCTRCLDAIRATGGDPLDVRAQRVHKQLLLSDFLRRSHEQAHRLRPGCQVDQNNQTRLGLGERATYLDNIDIEALPTGGWGYYYFPIAARYARTFGTSIYGMTGRFHRSWADFGGLKHPNQLRTELASIVAQGAHVTIGDQAPPSARLDPGVYETIGAAYAEIEALEPYLEGAAPAVEAAIVIDDLPLTDPGAREQNGPHRLSDSIAGAAKLMSESHVQFDVAEVDTDLDRYRLLVLPDALEIGREAAAKLASFVKRGGAVIASHDALRISGTSDCWLPNIGLTYAGESPFTPTYLVPEPGSLTNLPRFEFALYDGSARWLADRRTRAVALARIADPLFQRSAEHYTSHRQTPVDHLTEFVAVALHPRVGMCAFPIGTSYYRHGYWAYRVVFRTLLDHVLPERLVRTTAPISTDVAVTHQTAADNRRERWLVHLINYSANRRAPEHLETFENPAPLHDVDVDLTVPGPICRAYLAADGDELPLYVEDVSWHVTIPQVRIAAVAVFEVSCE